MAHPLNLPDLIPKGLDLIDQHGWKGFSLSQLASHLHVTEEELHTHCPTKQAFIGLWHDHLFALLQTHVSSAELVELSPKDRLAELLMLRFELMMPHKSALKRLFYGTLKDPQHYCAYQSYLQTDFARLWSFANLPRSSLISHIKVQAALTLYLFLLHRWFEKDLSTDELMALIDKNLSQGERLFALYA